MSALCWQINKTHFFGPSLLVSYQSWRSGWNRTSCPLQSVISSSNSANASKWFMCPTSPTSPIRMLRTRDSCELTDFIPWCWVWVGATHSSQCIQHYFQNLPIFWLRNENPGFRRIVEKLERSPVCQRLPLRSFLVLPFQRITRLKLLVQVCVCVCVLVPFCVFGFIASLNNTNF